MRREIALLNKMKESSLHGSLDTQLVCHASIYITLNLSVWSHPVAVYSTLFPIKEDLLC